MNTCDGCDSLERLSNADAVAGREREVRSVLETELEGCYDRLEHDGLGSALFMSAGAEVGPVRVMFAAHMDEVGFMVRHISDIGVLHLTVLGGVLDASKRMQRVRVTCSDGNKISGILNAKLAADGSVEDVYVDLGCETRCEVESLGVGIGDMVTFASEATPLAGDKIAGKALDDRAGLYILVEALKRLHEQDHAAEVWMAATSVKRWEHAEARHRPRWFSPIYSSRSMWRAAQTFLGISPITANSVTAAWSSITTRRWCPMRAFSRTCGLSLGNRVFPSSSTCWAVGGPTRGLHTSRVWAEPRL